MTALNYILLPDQVYIAMDTLASSEQKEPLSYFTKIFQVPHLKGVICGTGCSQIILDWYNFIQTQVIAKDIFLLNNFATEKLLEISAKYPQMSATIYHFGYNEKEECFYGFAFRSTKKYEIEKLVYGIGIKPPDELDLKYCQELIIEKRLPQVFIEYITMQKAIDQNKPKDERLGIGGEVIYLVMNCNVQYLTVCYRFDDYNDLFQQMLINSKAKIY